MSPSYWIIAAIIAGVIEIFTVGFWFLWLALSALLVALGASLKILPNLESQLLVFALLTLVFIIFTRPIVVKFIKTEDKSSNVSALIGQHGITLSQIKPLHLGQVKVNGEVWTAISDEEIEENTRIEVVGIDGVKLKIKKA
ncbi:NfeD family protein [Thermosyntropha sp.]|uniref:NfeD family protein n=1 Tax=Thermosyntropha sp. TaxID=2740820 RepID=UPI00260139DD|nr:NfeD family protein [Thermosyntropha sp.]MBO8158262.1 NfeD family protein [Thermosyntropha sp.]